ncbi:hypothetical protein FACS1894158_17060 [Betaproteobacteria bacterium]|nr:hypothetical protein FACS1894158_17060 [Betaproteobacteria bacterium]
MTAEQSKHDQLVLAEIWGDTVNMKHLFGAMLIGVVLGFSFYWTGLQVVRSYYPNIQASLSQAVALLVGIVGCLLAAVISAKLFPPKRSLTEQESTEEDRARILHELQVDITQEAADIKDMPQDILDEMRELQLDKLFQSSTSEKKDT